MPLKFILIFIICCLISPVVMGLTVDKKMKLRILATTTSKKTVLINKGREEGLAVGDHARFFDERSFVARGVLEKISASRSVWSIYHKISPSKIKMGRAMELVIISPVKISTDYSKSVEDQSKVSSGRDAIIPTKKKSRGVRSNYYSRTADFTRLNNLDKLAFESRKVDFSGVDGHEKKFKYEKKIDFSRLDDKDIKKKKMATFVDFSPLDDDLKPPPKMSQDDLENYSAVDLN